MRTPEFMVRTEITSGLTREAKTGFGEYACIYRSQSVVVTMHQKCMRAYSNHLAEAGIDKFV